MRAPPPIGNPKTAPKALPDATPSAENPLPFVSAMNATYAVCLALTGVAFVASLMRGGTKVGTPP